MDLSYSRSGKNTIALVAICLAQLMFALEISSVPVILSTLERVLHADFKDLQWIMNAYTIACTTVLMAAGTLADRYGRRLIFVISLIVFGLASLICGLTESTPLLIAGRFIQGMGGGSMFICLIAILSNQFKAGPERMKAFGIWGIFLGFGLGFGPIIGGVIAALSGWQWVFLIHVPLTLLTLALVFSSVEESNDPDAKKLDILGMATLSLTVFGLTYFITQGSELGFTSHVAIFTIVATLVSFVVFLFVEQVNPHPMFDFSVFRIRKFSGAIMGSIGMNFSFWPFIIFLPIFYQSALHYDIVTTGLSLLAYTLPTLVIPPLAERLSHRYQPGTIIPLGMFTIGLGFILMWYGSSFAHASGLTMLPGSLIAGIGLGLTNTPVTNTTTGSVPSNRAGMASGMDISARLITLAINIAAMGFILLTGIIYYLEKSLPGSFNVVHLRSLAENIAAGNLESLGQSFPELLNVDASGSVVHAALVHGFGWVMLYGGVGVWALGAISFMIFGGKKAQ
ncbi:MFS transporter [Caballeronia sp. SEWSISQ10-4 2]|uniref:MFS transporter n=1 Tax=Caballeronia sp. SEWSISQ10-4 2 TaxID=2937438 RepID=UPI00264C30BF|nr:MFS transporter [Caballeronia sp. SEWSISQ10-4 2]MDN7177168.1 MFS transporter [Caballeronia sp. SEWSISQ10-4 2]